MAMGPGVVMLMVKGPVRVLLATVVMASRKVLGPLSSLLLTIKVVWAVAVETASQQKISSKGFINA